MDSSAASGGSYQPLDAGVSQEQLPAIDDSDAGADVVEDVNHLQLQGLNLLQDWGTNLPGADADTRFGLQDELIPGLKNKGLYFGLGGVSLLAFALLGPIKGVGKAALIAGGLGALFATIVFSGDTEGRRIEGGRLAPSGAIRTLAEKSTDWELHVMYNMKPTDDLKKEMDKRGFDRIMAMKYGK